MSRPCGLRGITYVNRTIKVDNMYASGICTYDENNKKEHSLYYSAGFEDLESSVYRMNNLYDSIKKAIPDFSEEELNRNSY